MSMKLFFKKMVDSTANKWQEIKGITIAQDEVNKITSAGSIPGEPKAPLKNRGSLSYEFEVKGMSPEVISKLMGQMSVSAQAMTEPFKALQRNIEELTEAIKKQDAEERIMWEKVKLGIPLSYREKYLYSHYKMKEVHNEAEYRFKRSKIVPIQNIDHVHGFTFTAVFEGRFYWCDYSDSYNLADIRCYRRISQLLYHQLHQFKQTDYDFQKNSFNTGYHPENINPKGYKSALTNEDLLKLSNLSIIELLP